MDTYLYIKQHSITGMKYFGKTTRDPYTYLGSGKYWKNHIKKYGVEHVKTIWVKLFTDEDELTRTAIALSEMYDVVDSPFWANLINENGLDGLPTGHKHTNETRAKISALMKGENNPMYGKKHSEEHRAKLSAARQNISDEQRAKLSALMKGKNNPMYGKKHSEETKNIISSKLKGKKIGELNPFFGKTHSEETKAKLSKPQELVNCPYCGKEGGASIMKRWHFNNCKFK
jgi:hypothetical protein